MTIGYTNQGEIWATKIYSSKKEMTHVCLDVCPSMQGYRFEAETVGQVALRWLYESGPIIHCQPVGNSRASSGSIRAISVHAVTPL